jgi:hypothetical protein
MIGLHEHEVLPRLELVQHVDHLDVEALGIGASEHGEAVSFHARANVFGAKDRLLGGRSDSERRGQREAREDPHDEGAGKKGAHALDASGSAFHPRRRKVEALSFPLV